MRTENELKTMTYNNLSKLITEIKDNDMLCLIYSNIHSEMKKRGLLNDNIL